MEYYCCKKRYGIISTDYFWQQYTSDNHNCGKEQATTRQGEKRYAIEFPKYKKDGYITRKVMTRSSYGKIFAVIFIYQISVQIFFYRICECFNGRVSPVLPKALMRFHHFYAANMINQQVNVMQLKKKRGDSVLPFVLNN